MIYVSDRLGETKMMKKNTRGSRNLLGLELGQCRGFGGAHAQGFKTRAGLVVGMDMGNV